MTKVLRIFVCILISLLLLVSCSVEVEKGDVSSSAVTQPSPVPPSPTEAPVKDTALSRTFLLSTPEEQGMDSGLFEKADERILENYPNIYSLLVVRNGRTVFEKYYNGMDEDDCNPVFSITKSVMSACIGIALREKLITGVGQKVSEILPPYYKDVDDTRKKDITLENVLTMTGGLEIIDNDYGAFFSSTDWLEYTLKKPMIFEPGKEFDYNTGLTQMLSQVIAITSEMDTKEFAQKYLFDPLGIDAARWDTDATGHYGGGSGLYLTPADMAKFGYLYLQKGKWNSTQVIPDDWVAESVKKHVESDSSAGYGYLFWIWEKKVEIQGMKYFSFSAMGAGGQQIIVVPDLELVAVISANISRTSKDGALTDAVIRDYVIPSVK